MTIIEMEIEEREIKINNKNEKIATLENLKIEVAKLENEISNIDVSKLEVEIAELKTYLPKQDVSEEEVSNNPIY